MTIVGLDLPSPFAKAISSCTNKVMDRTWPSQNCMVTQLPVTICVGSSFESSIV
jgi:hypothetical protein